MIKIKKQEYEIPIATKSGWVTPTGLIGEINGVNVSYVLVPGFPIRLIISELSTGSEIMTSFLGAGEIAACDTQDKTIELFIGYSVQVAEKLSHVKNIDSYIKHMETKIVKLIGKMPELKETSV